MILFFSPSHELELLSFRSLLSTGLTAHLEVVRGGLFVQSPAPHLRLGIVSCVCRWKFPAARRLCKITRIPLRQRRLLCVASFLVGRRLCMIAGWLFITFNNVGWVGFGRVGLGWVGAALDGLGAGWVGVGDRDQDLGPVALLATLQLLVPLMLIHWK